MIKLIIFFGAIAASIFFYRVRCRKPFLYGIAELLVWGVIIYFVLFPVETNYL
jgi:hypothetical protein